MMAPNQVQNLMGSPTYRMSLARRLEAERSGMNNGTIPGGLASIVNAGTAAYLRGRDENQRAAAMDAFSGGMLDGSDIGTLDGQQPNAPRIEPGAQAVEARLAGMKGNPYAGRLSQMLAFQRMAAEQEAARIADQRAYEGTIYERNRADQLADIDDQRRWTLANRKPTQRQTATGADGHLYYLDTGERALPHVNAQQPPTYRTMSPEEAEAHGFDLPPNAVVQVAPDGQYKIVQPRTPAQTNVNVTTGASGPQIGTIPQGQQLITDSETGALRLEDIPGSKAAVAGEKADKKAKDSARNMLASISDARNIVQNATVPVTGFGSLAKAIPGTPAHNLNVTLNTIKAGVSFDTLQAMRAASPTGGALGAVSEREITLLQASIAALEQSQSEEQFLRNLARVERTYNEIIHGPSALPSRGPTGNGIVPAPNAGGQPSKRRRFDPATGKFMKVR